jgi:hypothetical protein
MHLFLERRLTPHQALVNIDSAPTFTGTTLDYKPLMDWLRVAATQEGNAAIKRASRPGAPIMDTVLPVRLVSMVCQDLPGWNVPATSGQAATMPPTGPSRLETLLAKILIVQHPCGTTTSPAGE